MVLLFSYRLNYMTTGSGYNPYARNLSRLIFKLFRESMSRGSTLSMLRTTFLAHKQRDISALNVFGVT